MKLSSNGVGQDHPLFDKSRIPKSPLKGLQALYYPYSRSFNKEFLKQALFLFDVIWFSDPMERFFRETIMYGETGRNKKWDSIKDDYDFLEEEGCVRILNPVPIVREYDGLVGQAISCDSHDENFMKLANQARGNDHWGILKMKIPDNVTNRLQKTSNVKFHSKIRQIKTPSPSSAELLNKTYMEKDYGTYFDRSSPLIQYVEHSYIPINIGYSLNVNVALLISEMTGLILLSDDEIALKLLDIKYNRAIKENEKNANTTPYIIKKSPAYYQKLNIVDMNVCNALIPEENLSKRSFEDIVIYRNAEQKQFERFRSLLFELTSTVESELWSKDLEKEIIKLIDSKILPESQKIRDDLKKSYEKMFGEFVKKSVSGVTPTLIVSFLSGLSSGQILSLSCAAMAGILAIALPELIDVWKTKKDMKRNALNFLLSF